MDKQAELHRGRSRREANDQFVSFVTDKDGHLQFAARPLGRTAGGSVILAEPGTGIARGLRPGQVVQITV